MGKRGSGPEGPDRDPEPFENETPEAAQKYHSADCDPVQPCLDALFSQYPIAFEGIDRDRVLYDSGWDDSSGIAVRLVFGAGPEIPMLREWIWRMAFEGGAFAGEDG